MLSIVSIFALVILCMSILALLFIYVVKVLVYIVTWIRQERRARKLSAPLKVVTLPPEINQDKPRSK